MRKIIGLAVLVGGVIAQLSLAQAATEVLRLPANNQFISAVSTDPVTGLTTGVFVTRVLGEPGGPVDTVTVIVSSETVFNLASGVLPQGAFQVSARSASLDVDINAITLDTVIGELPANGVISLDWQGDDIQRTAGNAKFDLGNGQAVIVGTRTEVAADLTGTIFGAPPADDAIGSISAVRMAVIVITFDP